MYDVDVYSDIVDVNVNIAAVDVDMTVFCECRTISQACLLFQLVQTFLLPLMFGRHHIQIEIQDDFSFLVGRVEAINQICGHGVFGVAELHKNAFCCKCLLLWHEHGKIWNFFPDLQLVVNVGFLFGTGIFIYFFHIFSVAPIGETVQLWKYYFSSET